MIAKLPGILVSSNRIVFAYSGFCSSGNPVPTDFKKKLGCIFEFQESHLVGTMLYRTEKVDLDKLIVGVLVDVS